MSWFFDAAPYILAIGAILLAGLELARDWKEYKKPWARMTAAVVLVVIAIVSLISLHHDNTEKEAAAVKAEAEMKALQGKVDAANRAQENNTTLFLGALGKMSDQVSDLKSEVKTEALQKKLAGVQADLQKTVQALAPGPKAELTFTFVPFTNPVPPQQAVPTTEVKLPLNPDGSVHVTFTIVDFTSVDAIEPTINVKICDGCRYAKAPAFLTEIAEADETWRFVKLPTLHAKEAWQTIPVDVIPPSWAQRFMVGFSYRCHTCVLPNQLAQGWVTIVRP